VAVLEVAGAQAKLYVKDMDQPALKGKFKGKTLLDLCESPKNVDPAVWLEFYAGVPGTNPVRSIPSHSASVALR
jgi:hypothetical protein